jgi:hypothetical protein|tara:strand:+ start:1531 stop:1812 length:282 start_codon:yes stop_codon:yes gene_type:complete
MARYPELPRLFNLSDKQLINMYTAIERWGSALLNELNTRDTQVETTPSTNIYTISTVTQLKNPQKGDIAYSVSSGKFKGYVSLGAETSWQNLN